MTTNAIAISRRLVTAGMEQKTADAVAEEIVDYSDELAATKTDLAELKAELKTDIARLEGKIDAVATQVKLLTGLVAGLYVGLAILFVDKIVG